MRKPDFLRSLFTADCILIVERDGAISWCNAAASDLFGIQEGFVVSRDFAFHCGLFHPESDTTLRFEDFPVGRIFAGETIEDVELCVRSPRTAGEDLWLSVTIEPVFSVDLREVEAAMVLCHDIADRRRALQGLEDAHAALQALVHASPLPIVAIELDGRINFWNSAAETVFGWSEAEVVGQPMPYIPADRKEEHLRMRQHDLKGEVFVNNEIRRQRKDGTPIDLSVSTAPIRDRTGALTGTICVYVDITERRRLEERLRQAEKVQSLANLAAGVAHDFNNLLTGILGHASLALEDAIPGSEQERALRNVIAAGDRAVGLTSQMLAYSGSGRFFVEPVDLSSLVRAMVPPIQSSVGKRISLNLDLPPGLPLVEADSRQIRQLVMNLVLNASEAIQSTAATGKAAVWVRTGVEELKAKEYHGILPAGALARDGSYCLIEIRDSGSGMDRATQERMFDPFFTTKFTGRGLGLAAVLGIVRGHKGTIQVTSAPNEGACFRIYLPVAASGSDPGHIMMTG